MSLIKILILTITMSSLKAVVPNCAVHSNTQQTKCLTCVNGFKRISATNCASCGSGTNCNTYVTNACTCTLCNSHYRVSSGSCVHCPTPLPDQNCINFDNCLPVCINCINHFHLDKTNTCQQNNPLHSDDCTQSDGFNDRCYFCVATFFKKNGVCLTTNPSNQCQIDTDVNDLPVPCVKCQSLFYFDPPNSNNCVAIVNSISNCLESGGYIDACTRCKDGFAPNASGLCVANPLNRCFTFKINPPNPPVCEKCHPLYYLSNGSCLPVPDPNCFSSKGSGYCSWCKTGYYLTSPVCAVQSLPNCLEYVPNRNICQKCASKFYVSEFQGCQPITNAAFCKGSLGHVNFCESSNPVENPCIPGYYLQFNVCAPVPLSQNCENYQPCEAKCKKCVSGYYINSITFACVQIPDCLFSYGFVNQCVTCKDGRAWNETTSTCTTTMTFCNNPGTVCTSCFAGYYFDGTSCVKIDIPNCAEASGPSTCTKCFRSYYLGPNGASCSRVTGASNSNGVYNQATECAHPVLTQIPLVCSDDWITDCIERDGFQVCNKCRCGFKLFKNPACSDYCKLIGSVTLSWTHKNVGSVENTPSFGLFYFYPEKKQVPLAFTNSLRRPSLGLTVYPDSKIQLSSYVNSPNYFYLKAYKDQTNKRGVLWITGKPNPDGSVYAPPNLILGEILYKHDPQDSNKCKLSMKFDSTEYPIKYDPVHKYWNDDTTGDPIENVAIKEWEDFYF